MMLKTRRKMILLNSNMLRTQREISHLSSLTTRRKTTDLNSIMLKTTL